MESEMGLAQGGYKGGGLGTGQVGGFGGPCDRTSRGGGFGTRWLTVAGSGLSTATQDCGRGLVVAAAGVYRWLVNGRKAQGEYEGGEKK